MKRTFVVFLALSPGFWWIIFQPGPVAKELSRTKQYLISNIKSSDRGWYQAYLQDMRWGGENLHRDNLVSKTFYNRLAAVPKEFIDLLQFMTPKLYFLAGDGSQFSPHRIEPISSLLFPFWILGLIYCLKFRRFKPLLALGAAALFACIVGRRNMVFLFPALILNVFIATLGWQFLPPRFSKILTPVVIFYGVYLLEMSVWFRPVA